ncbi:molybdenum cofactor guanylyltransferase [Porticoccus litoralis]|uniref:Molybdenum cofactor guanylyltransferase n=1 Tax=Porticoccus litoralis TaxID=434086 RepID=A0AAW8B788_9GAMM|nr:molybdenum cofactor guanylyltransferase [Porticoccus litoralis]MDP1521468.1 molybdenum cofactor guanylyltransferase [Porticoccus litoralis]
MSDTKPVCVGLILAGGGSTRMGIDKSLLRREQQTMLTFSRSLLSTLGLDTHISGGRQGMADVTPQAGPLGGIYSSLKTLQSDALLVLPVDMPLLTPKLLHQLMDVGERLGVPVCYEDCYLPLYLPVNAGLRNYLDEVFAEGSQQPRSIKKMLSALGGKQLPLSDRQPLINANTPEEWQSAMALLAGGHDQQ